MINEGNIINQVIAGNTGAYRLLVDAYKDLVFSLVIKILRNREEAEEVTQDTFLKAYHALPNFKNESRFSTWLFRIAYNTTISRTRKKVVVMSAIDDYIIENISVDNVQESLEQFDEAEKLRILKFALDKLPEEEQLIINLFYFNKQSIDDICLITGLTDSNVKVKLHRIRKKMYAIMSEELNKKHVISR